MNCLTRPPIRIRSPWLKRLGTFGFAFFFIKGLVWLAFVYVAQTLI